MNKGQIFKKAIEKAVKNGYCTGFLSPEFGLRCEANSPESEETCVYTNIFSNDFAKAFWGGGIKNNVHGCSVQYSWSYHLQEMVVYEEPLEYIEKFLK